MARWTIVVAVPSARTTGTDPAMFEARLSAALRAIGVEMVECHYEDVLAEDREPAPDPELPAVIERRQCCGTLIECPHANTCSVLNEMLGWDCPLLEVMTTAGERVVGVMFDVELGEGDDPGSIVVELASGDPRTIAINNIAGFEEIDA